MPLIDELPEARNRIKYECSTLKGEEGRGQSCSQIWFWPAVLQGQETERLFLFSLISIIVQSGRNLSPGLGEGLGRLDSQLLLLLDAGLHSNLLASTTPASSEDDNLSNFTTLEVKKNNLAWGSGGSS